MCADKYPNAEFIYTDGSKGCNGAMSVGAAAVYGDTVNTEALPAESSIYTAEVYAIRLAMQIAEESNKNFFVIVSDSNTALAKLSRIEYTDPYVQRLQHSVFEM